MAEAEQAIHRLVDGGFARESISIVGHPANCGPAIGPVPTVTSEGSLGAAAAVAGLGGFAVGVVALAIPGIGPILAAGPVAAELVAGGVGSVTGGVINWMKQMGVPDNDAGSFCEALRRGGILLSVESPDERAAEAQQIIGEHRLIDMDESTLEWHLHFDSSKAESGDSTEAAPRSLPFDPERLSPSARRQQAARRGVRSYFRVS
jgi:hypothetical protein